MAGTDLPIQPVQQECPECKATIKRYTHNQSRYFGCVNCSSWLQIKPDGSLQRDRSVEKKTRLEKYPLQPGMPITFNEIKYIIISRAVKADKSAMEYQWREYGLFHPLHGYAWLSEYDGHWLLLKETDRIPEKVSSSEITFDQKTFRLYQKYRTATISAAGEFPSNVLKENVRYYEYISPPYLLSNESAKSLRNWFLGESIFPDDVAKAAGIDKIALPYPVGVGAAQVRKSNFSHQALVRVSLAALALLLIIQIISSTSAQEKQVALIDQNLPDTLMGTTVASRPFILTGTAALEFDYHSDVNNNWAEAEIMLINDKTNETRGLSIGVEYYSGMDEDGLWTEGETRDTKILSSVAPGIYHLNVKQAKGYSGSGGNAFDLTVKHDVPVSSNFFVVALIIALFPLVSFVRKRQFEKSRWMNSDYSPFDTEDDDQ
jgi:hypothetical protein